MQSKFFTWATSLILITSSFALRAGGAPAPEGYIRFWNMLPASDGPMDLRRAGSSPTEAPLTGKSPYGRYNSYLEYSPGAYHLAVNKTGEPQKPFANVNINLLANTYFTVLAAPTSQGSSVQVINDTNDPKATAATLTVRNYYQGVTVDVFQGTKQIVKALAYGDSVVVSDLPLEHVPLTIRTILPNKTHAESGAEANFKLSKRATLLIIPDGYGRFRPRVTVDGKNF